jgi:hypothetical protein
VIHKWGDVNCGTAGPQREFLCGTIPLSPEKESLWPIHRQSSWT